MRNQCMFLSLLFVLGSISVTNAQNQKFFYQEKSPFILGLEYYAKMGSPEENTSSTSAVTALEVADRIKQFETEYNAAANAATLAAHFSADAVLVESNGKTVTGAYAIGQMFASFFEVATCQLTITLDEVMELPGGYALSRSHYLNKITMKKDQSKQEAKGKVMNLYRKENGEWKILRHMMVASAE